MKSKDSLKLQLKNILRFDYESGLICSSELSTQIYIWQQFHSTALAYCNKQLNLDFNLEEENIMTKVNLIKFLIQDILASGEYTLEGIATYTNIPIDLITDIVAEFNTNPSFEVSTKIIYLHTTVRRGLYETISKQVVPLLSSCA